MKTYENWSSLSLFLCILLFYEFLMYFIVFNFYVFYCFMISAVWDLHLDQYQAELMIYKAKRGQTDWFIGQNEKLTFKLPFVLYTKWKKSHFLGWPLVAKGHVTPWREVDFRKLGVKISARLQRKKSLSGVAEITVVLRAPPPPPF